MSSFECHLLRRVFSEQHEYEDENLWMKKYIDAILLSASKGTANLTDLVLNYESPNLEKSLNPNKITDIFLYLIKTCVSAYSTISVTIGKDNKIEQFKMRYSPIAGIMSSLLYVFTKPVVYKQNSNISYETTQEHAYRYEAIQNLMEYSYKFGAEKISTHIMKKGYEPSDEFIIYLVYTRQFRYLDLLLKYHPVSSDGCYRIFKEIERSAEEAMKYSDQKEKYNQFIANGRRYFM